MTRLRPGSCEADRLEIILLLGVRQHGDFAFDLGRDDDGDRAFLGRLRASPASEKALPLSARSLFDVADIEHRLRGQEAERLEERAAPPAHACGARRAALAQFGEAAVRRGRASPSPPCRAPLAFFSIATTRRSRLSRSASISSVSIVSISRERIDAALDMSDVAVLEAAHDMGDGVAFADIGEELVAETLALRGAAHEAGDIDEGQPRRDDLLRAGDLGEGRRAEGRARRHRRHWARSCRTDNWPPAPPRSASSALKSVDLPTLGRPTMPHLKPMDEACLSGDGRPYARAGHKRQAPDRLRALATRYPARPRLGMVSPDNRLEGPTILTFS